MPLSCSLYAAAITANPCPILQLSTGAHLATAADEFSLYQKGGRGDDFPFFRICTRSNRIISVKAEQACTRGHTANLGDSKPPPSMTTIL